MHFSLEKTISHRETVKINNSFSFLKFLCETLKKWLKNFDKFTKYKFTKIC